MTVRSHETCSKVKANFPPPPLVSLQIPHVSAGMTDFRDGREQSLAVPDWLWGPKPVVMATPALGRKVQSSRNMHRSLCPHHLLASSFPSVGGP